MKTVEGPKLKIESNSLRTLNFRLLTFLTLSFVGCPVWFCGASTAHAGVLRFTARKVVAPAAKAVTPPTKKVGTVSGKAAKAVAKGVFKAA